MPRKIRGYSQCSHRLPIFALAPPKKSLNPDWNEAQGSVRCRNVQRNWGFQSFTVVWTALDFCLFLTNATENPRLQPVSPQITYFRTRTPQKFVKSALERSSVLGRRSVTEFAKMLEKLASGASFLASDASSFRLTPIRPAKRLTKLASAGMSWRLTPRNWRQAPKNWRLTPRFRKLCYFALNMRNLAVSGVCGGTAVAVFGQKILKKSSKIPILVKNPQKMTVFGQKSSKNDSFWPKIFKK